MDQNLSVSILPTIKLLIRLWRLFNPDLVGDDEGRLGASRDDHVAEIAVVLLDVALACAYGQALCLALDVFLIFSFPFSLLFDSPSQTASQTKSTTSPCPNSHLAPLDHLAHTNQEHRSRPLDE
jgi:hypothetical protein